MMRMMKYRRKKNQLPTLHSNLILTRSFATSGDPKGAQLAKKVMVPSKVEFVTPQDNAFAALYIRVVRKTLNLLF